MKITARHKSILNFIADLKSATIAEIQEKLDEKVSTATLNRDLALLIEKQYLVKTGASRAVSYSLAPAYKILSPCDLDDYFNLDPDQRHAVTQFNFDLMADLKSINLFAQDEASYLESLKKEYQENIRDFPEALYQKELERLTIELSWKSSQIEGNTYSLLETERLFKEKEVTAGKPKEDAFMLLNHKDALDYILEHKKIGRKITLRSIEEIHSLLVKDLGVGRNIRSRSVGITGTAYKPLDNAHQIKEAMELMCGLINNKGNTFEKALLAIAIISYIQPFEDGNKRTARMVSNAILIADDACPLSYRSVEVIDYKKAMLLFYEQSNISEFKRIFIEQNEFAVKNYFS